MMCMGEITTRQGTRVFYEDDYQKLKDGDDFDNDGLKNGEEVFVATVNGKYYAFMVSDPTLQYSDTDDFNDFEEHQMNTNPNKPNLLVTSEEYLDVSSGSGFVYAETAEEYLNRNEVGLALAYFTDTVLCGSESYFNIIKQEVESAYLAITGSESTIGSQNLLVKEDKALLVDYLKGIMTHELSEDDYLIMSAIEYSKKINDGLDALEKMSNGKINATGKLKDYLVDLKDNKLEQPLREERKAIRKLMSDTDKLRNERKTRKLTNAEKNTIRDNMTEISRRQSDMDHGYGIFDRESRASIDQRYKDSFEKAGHAFAAFQVLTSSVSKAATLMDYASDLATFQEYREFVNLLSQSDFEYVAEAAKLVAKDIDASAEGKYLNLGAGEVFMKLMSDVSDQLLDDVISAAELEVAGIWQAVRIVSSLAIGQNLSYQRINLLSADLTTEITFITLDKVQSNCKDYRIFENGTKGWVCEDTNNCINVSQYMQFCILGKSIAEQKYINLAKKQSGFLGALGYNPLDNSDSTLDKAKNNIERMDILLLKYMRVYAI